MSYARPDPREGSAEGRDKYVCRRNRGRMICLFVSTSKSKAVLVGSVPDSGCERGRTCGAATGARRIQSLFRVDPGVLLLIVCNAP